MPDRTIPYYNLIMRCDRITGQRVPLPDGYKFIRYQNGLESAWAGLETEIGDFPSEAEAEAYFSRTYLSNPELLREKALFIADKTGQVTGSCIAWHDQRFDKSVSSLHWLIVKEVHQGRGLGRALCCETMTLFDSFPVYIHTQPWSWKAILLYISLGFRLQKTDTFAGYENQYEAGIEVLRSVLTDEQFRYIIKNTEM